MCLICAASVFIGILAIQLQMVRGIGKYTGHSVFMTIWLKHENGTFRPAAWAVSGMGSEIVPPSGVARDWGLLGVTGAPPHLFT